MSWRDKIKSNSVDGQMLTGSFRGARFIVPTSDEELGRRHLIHEYPLRDKPYIEDLGLKIPTFRVDVFVDSSLTSDGNYITARDALREALNAPGSGTLIHPWYGALTVSVIEASLKQSTRDGGRATFRLAFAQADDIPAYPAATRDTAWTVEHNADAALESGKSAFASIWSVDGLPEWGLAELESDITRALSKLEDLVGGVTNDVASEIRAPANMAAAIVGSMQRLGKE